MFIAFLIGLLTAFVFTPLALVPVGLIFAVSSLAISGDLSWAGLGRCVLAIVAMNAGYLIGAVIHRRVRASGRHDTMLA
jgi:hypothetical protein